jgi:branched-chain amino acid aminotransferase
VVKIGRAPGLQCPLTVDQMFALCREGIGKFPADAELYIRPLVFGTEGLLIRSSRSPLSR